MCAIFLPIWDSIIVGVRQLSAHPAAGAYVSEANQPRHGSTVWQDRINLSNGIGILDYKALTARVGINRIINSEETERVARCDRILEIKGNQPAKSCKRNARGPISWIRAAYQQPFASSAIVGLAQPPTFQDLARSCRLKRRRTRPICPVMNS